jgi:hypothetical protein
MDLVHGWEMDGLSVRNLRIRVWIKISLRSSGVKSPWGKFGRIVSIGLLADWPASGGRPRTLLACKRVG